MTKGNLREFFWRLDVDDFKRIKKLRDLARKIDLPAARKMAERYNQKLLDLQAKWKNHKLGELE